ncbi:MAG: nucleotidyl transferase AbiEii/AbiGii toxin family protein [Verrucomicrobiaceae bacterium]|nr:nucleotidyl transferase AbiEii/AbiGii toxin family protein [Verrucomicrobiaceae bacterium]
MQSLTEFLMRAERRGELRLLLIGGRSLEAHGLVRFTKDVDFLVATQDIPVMSDLLTRIGYSKFAETAVFSRWKHSSMMADDVDVMYVSPETFEKLLMDSKIFEIGTVSLRVPSIPSLIALKLHAMKSNGERLEKDGRDVAELLRLNPGVLDKTDLEALFTKYGCQQLFPKFSHLVS